MCDSDAVVVNVKDKVSAFKKLLAESGSSPVVVLFKADFCGHCQHVKPKFESIRLQCQKKKSDLKIVIAEVNTSGDLFQEYGVDAFPVTILFRNGQIEEKVIGADDAKLKKLFTKLGFSYN